MFIFYSILIYCAESLSGATSTETEEEIKIKVYGEFLLEDVFYFFVLTNALFQKERDIYKTHLETENFLRSFPFLNLSKDPLKPLLYGAIKEFSYDQILEWIEGFFPYGEIKEGLIDIISKGCYRTGEIRVKTDKKETWQDILLSFQLPNIVLGTIKNLFDNRYRILSDRKKITGEGIEKSKFFKEMAELKVIIQEYHGIREQNTSILRKSTSKEFEDLIKKVEETVQLEIKHQEEKKEKNMNLINENLKDKLKKNFEAEKKNSKRIRNEIIKTESMTKIFIVIYQFSQHLIKRGFKESIGTMTPEQLVGLSFIICIAKMVNDGISFYEKNDKENITDQKENLIDEKYLMGKFIKWIEESNLEDTKKILKCIEIMQSDNLYTTKRQDFINIFKNREENGNHIKNIESKKTEENEEQK